MCGLRLAACFTRRSAAKVSASQLFRWRGFDFVELAPLKRDSVGET
jgi:hypothetical protein